MKNPFFKEWRGFRNNELKNISGLNLIFCHSTGFYLVAETLEDAKKACLISLNCLKNYIIVEKGSNRYLYGRVYGDIRFPNGHMIQE